MIAEFTEKEHEETIQWKHVPETKGQRNLSELANSFQQTGSEYEYEMKSQQS